MARLQLNIVFLIFVITAFAVEFSSSMVAKRQTEGPSDECRGLHYNPMKMSECCSSLQGLKPSDDALQGCLKEVKENPAFQKPPGGPNGDNPPPPPGGPNGDHPPPPPGGKSGDGPKVHMPCLKECLFNKTGAVGTDGKLNKENIKTRIMGLLAKESELQQIIEPTIEKCFTAASGGDHANHVCKSGAFEFSGCIQREIVLNCPSNKWNESEECGNIKTQMQNCPPPE